jgi:peptide/nickel transport system substrate-binding protein
MHRSTRRSTMVVALSVCVTLTAAAACSGDDDDDDTADSVSAEATATTASDTDAESSTDSTAPGSTEPGTTSGGATTAPAATDAPAAEERVVGPGEHHVGDEGTPVKGGTLVFGLEADTANGWAPYRASYQTSGYIPLTSISDTLFTVNDAGETVPLLVESVDHNADYTEWTLHMRDGIKFHDGTPLDGAAVKFNLDANRASPLTGGALTPIDTVTANGQDVVITLKGGPWVALPIYLTYASIGYMMSPTWLASLPDVPQRTEGGPVYDAAVAAKPADGDPAKPIGLGAFKFESYTPGNGNTFRAVRNDDYWRGPNGITGEDLPYLDAIEAVATADIDSRQASLRSGQFDAMHTANSDAISQLLDDDGLEVSSTSRFGDTSYYVMNMAQGPETDPEGKNAANPLLNVHCRRALAHAIDRQRMTEDRGAGLVLPANGPFPPGSIGYLEDNGYPDFNVDKAREEMTTCLSDLGTDKISFRFDTTNDPFNVETGGLVQSMWADAFGDEVESTITPVEQGQYVGRALNGDFDVLQGRGYAGLDPDQQRQWWQKASASPVGKLALNVGRFYDDVFEENLQIIKSNPDPAARKAAAEAINRRFGEQVYQWWWSWTLWGIATQPYVNGIETNTLPDGTKGIGLAFAGRHQTNQIWCDDGRCE